MTTNFVQQILSLPRPLPPVLGVGAYLKNAVCLIQGDQALISVENGSLDTVASIENFQKTTKAFLAQAIEKPVAVAHDWHPDFYCTRWAKESDLRSVGIQHHHAHTVSVMAEHGLEEPVLGLSLDGFGLGERNEAWGGELLLVDADGFRRLGHLRVLPQPGGDIAARQPWRMGAAALWAMGRGAEIATRFASFQGASHLASMMDRGTNAPLTSSAGRLFDAACGLLGVKPIAAFEGEAPMALERLAGVTQVDESSRDSRIDPSLWRIDSTGDSILLDLLPLLENLIDKPAPEGAGLFHDVLAEALRAFTHKASQQTGIRKVALSGGCFFNKRLRERLVRGMIADGLEPLLPKRLLPGDMAIALGQATAAALMIEKEDC